MEENKSWDHLHAEEDLKVLDLERELLAEKLGVSSASLRTRDIEEIVIEEEAENTWNLTYNLWYSEFFFYLQFLENSVLKLNLRDIWSG